ncbi:RB1-inducible coiled-coil protein 1 isoform X1 [Colossoma macropomum]|uniref:RB1-inducible coiled-coil protein 1 isoform X1 n=1 Tax=Colossoma macropomum TaxID=42526 RepID=UPI001863C4D2|nr:RB1-inducible coiled-coil protein 1 isoform X1 [Colossoma macropomum]XP_036447847.1 RB1-inducible coiled-coil protein 1 isoform X1 [Colossoma macropomum]XP_036447855.1 RB1-inducible coiled-coil protein 1 isoform X1 [Colossoma macropomum]XP_036447864.1 RB1-inducible coiled-coil protein 1 isoform X1 [Colossoma macropomum]
MKLYVFQVNNGSTLTFDTELAVQTVLDLKHAIQTKYKIATQHQVLVVNGGECMVAERRVCSYSAGTDTNPIFLFNKEMILCDRAPTIPKTTFSIENEMELKVEESLMMPAVFHTVASRTQLAVEMFEVAKKLCSFCERLVHDEHLQHQGWAAIMANLDDCTLSYQKLLWKFDMAYTNYQQNFEDIKLKLTKLGTAVSVMAKIPLLECLTRHSYRESLEKSSSPRPRTEEEEDADNDEVGGEMSTQSAILCHPDGQRNPKSPTLVSASGEAAAQALPPSSQDRLEGSRGLQEALEEEQEQEAMERGATPSFNVTLLDWINVQDRPNDVEAVVRKCFDSINRLDPRIIQPFLADCRDTITKLDNQNMKAIKGLEDRLYALDQMIASCKKLVNEQKELAQGFLANQKRAENLKDTSVLPDLCLSHANQLMIMLTNHRKLLDIKQKCTTAKQELANNLQVRLKWCCYVMLHADQDGEKLQALLRLLTELLERVRVVEALSTVPQMYCLAVVEVVRRKMFVKHYREWANALVKDGKNLYEAEKAKRETFGKLFRKSFLRNRLFRGLDSWPPLSFCTRKPRRFDFELPDISLTDLQYLKSCCPAEVQPFLRVPSLCDFEPLNHHVEALHQLVQAAQSVDEMSQTITDLLSELKVSGSQSAQRPIALTPRSESRTETTPTSPKVPSSLTLQSPPCQPLPLPAPLEDLSPDSIDAHTFDFETIGHPNMDPVLQQGSLDLDSLAESPESDFMSAVNEFVIEENVMSPNPISDPTSPEMMVESLYSSVINAIDSKRIQDTTTLERENSRITVLKLTVDRYRSAAEESQSNFRKIKDDLSHFRGLVLKEQRDFGFALKKMSSDMHSIVNSIKYCHEEELKEMHQNELENLRADHKKQILDLNQELEENRNIVRDVQRAMLELEGLVERKEKELAQLEGERERSLEELRSSHQQAVQKLEKKVSEQNEVLRDALLSKDALASQLESLHVEIECSQKKIRQEMENSEKNRLQELEARLSQEHQALLETLKQDNQNALDALVQENQAKLKELTESYSVERKECEGRFKDYEARIAELADARCKLEVEMALKEAETEELRLQDEEARAQREEVLKAEMMSQTSSLQKQVNTLMQQLQKKNEEYELGLAELRALMRLEKDHCISELVDRHEEESTLLRHEFSVLKQKSQDAEKDLEERLLKIQHEQDVQLAALQKEHEEEQRAFQEKEQDLQTTISDLQAENALLSGRLEHERQEAQRKVEEEKEAAKETLNHALKDFELQKEELEARLLGKIKLLENQLEERQSTEKVVTAGGQGEVMLEADLDNTLQQRLEEERASLLAKLELLEKKKNEELQNLKTSLIAEQQTNFNTVLTREKLKKEQIINELSEKLKEVTLQQEKDKSLIETLSEDRASILQEKKQLEEELNRLRCTALVSSTFVVPSPVPAVAEVPGACGPSPVEAPALPALDSERLVSVATLRDDDRVDSAVEASMMTVHDNTLMLSEEKQRILILERTLHMKEEENKRLSQRLMSQSMSSVSSRHSEKIAIRDFQVGDLVLIILDERHDNYVLFTVGPTLYFLHSESLTALDLKPVTGATRRPWVLGKVMEKEYCQAKKAQNRFKVPLGTKFYRVKAVPWNKKV